ncbi:hypothetical protein E2C01_046671 [Portunus trituberculatus]|uniref:Uncharacterized protein n=1 Tax=Portunus trituberculatus TaxID=210409 RepID=A0A5B7G8D6_PORTR|nr:hypothetical protein [Portunus trituberculatus]
MLAGAGAGWGVSSPPSCRAGGSPQAESDNYETQTSNCLTAGRVGASHNGHHGSGRLECPVSRLTLGETRAGRRSEWPLSGEETWLPG